LRNGIKIKSLAKRLT